MRRRLAVLVFVSLGPLLALVASPAPAATPTVTLIPPAVWERSADGTVTYSEFLTETLPGPFAGWGTVR